MLTIDELKIEAARTGFRPEILNKVHQLLELLVALGSHPFLKTRIALKGGTALNLFVFEAPRLSVDIDLNYLGPTARESMLAEKPKLEQAIQAVSSRMGLQIKRAPHDHAGGKWRLSYPDSAGQTGTLELDINFMLRTPLWPHHVADSHILGSAKAQSVPLMDVHELAAGKLAALFSRCTARDLFDARLLLQNSGIDKNKLRLGFVVYGGINRRDFRTVTLADIRLDPGEASRNLIPILRTDIAPKPSELKAWTQQLVSDCKDLCSLILPMTHDERKFLTRLNDHGEIVSELLTDDPRISTVIQHHPGLRWKAMNVRKHRGIVS